MTAGFKTGGRTKGTPNKATAEIRALAQQHGPAAIKRLAWLSLNAASEQTQAFAAEKLLDRGYGRAIQSISSDQDNPQKIEISWKSG